MGGGTMRIHSLILVLRTISAESQPLGIRDGIGGTIFPVSPRGSVARVPEFSP